MLSADRDRGTTGYVAHVMLIVCVCDSLPCTSWTQKSVLVTVMKDGSMLALNISHFSTQSPDLGHEDSRATHTHTRKVTQLVTGEWGYLSIDSYLFFTA